MEMNIPLGGDMRAYLDLYRRYQRDPDSVPIDWLLFFEGAVSAERNGESAEHAEVVFLVRRLIDAFRSWGHLAADLDPLGCSVRTDPPQIAGPMQDLEPYRDRDIDLEGELGLHQAKVSAVIRRVRDVYGSRIGFEFAHLSDPRQRTWLQGRIERAMSEPLEPEALVAALQTIVQADEFEAFFHARFPTKKRFGIEGAEVFLVFLQEAIRRAALAGIEDVVMGGMHRGRLNMLANVMGKPLAEILAEVKGRDLQGGEGNLLGDVPYHLGYSGECLIGGRRLRLSLASHPSHLMAVAPVVLGRTRAKQRLAPEDGVRKVLCMLLHTDAAFSGQGLTSELLQLSALKGFSVGGTIHCIVNNQLGFTTLPSEGRSSRYCTDVGKMIEAPIFHVNAADPEAAVRVARLAVDWRNQFGCDVLIDLVCYRRNGHNELDEPRFTQPRLYSAIDAKGPLRPAYIEQISRTVPEAPKLAAAFSEEYRAKLVEAYDRIPSYRPNRQPWLAARWSGVAAADESQMLETVETGIDAATLRKLGRAMCAVPDGMHLHPKAVRFQTARLATIDSGDGINWATAEALAISSLLTEGFAVRFSGQDAVRGTFTQRHWALHDQVNGTTFVHMQNLPMQNLVDRQARFEPVNSPLSEYAVLAFEYGYSLADPRQLVVWEAQFGDFANCAQVIIDQFIVCGEAKWMCMSGLVLLLPHGLEGQGPDHSSARIERFLQHCAAGNMFVVNCSTPANYFHVLRRQLHAAHRKPLVVIAPKSLLRNKACVSKLDAMAEGAAFRPILGDDFQHADADAVERVILCSGKVYYDLDTMRRKHGRLEHTAIVRIEQLYPLASDDLRSELARYPNARLVWCQEEPANQGAGKFMKPRIEAARGVIATSDRRSVAPVVLVARKASPAPAGGSIERHEREQEELLRRAIFGPDGGAA